MSRLRNRLLLLLLAGMCLAQDSDQLVFNKDVRRVGERLACRCGACNNSVGSCPMLQCHSAHPARQKIEAMQAEGKTDQQIVDSFVKEAGLQALSEPPASGFSLLAWVAPGAAILAGLGFIAWFVKRQRQTPATVPDISEADLARYRSQVEKETAALDE